MSSALLIYVYVSIVLIVKRKQFRQLTHLVQVSLIAYALYTPYCVAMAYYVEISDNSL